MATVESELHRRIAALAEEEFGLLGIELVELELLGGGRRLTLRFSVERAEADEKGGRGATVDQCARASRAIGRRIEAEEAEAGEFLPGRYTIEVSSPGIFRRLSRPEHFRRHVGALVKLVAEVGEGQSLELRGELVEAGDASLTISDPARGRHELPFGSIRRAHLDPDLDFGRGPRSEG